MENTENMLDEADPLDTDEPLKKSRYHHGDLRAGLIEATRRLVEQKGPDGFSVSDACRLAGVSTAAPYKHFKDKNDMLVAVVMDGLNRHRANTLAALEGVPEGSPDRVKAMGREYVKFALAEQGIFRLKYGGFTDRLDDDTLRTSGEDIYEMLLREVAMCIGEPEISQEVRRRGYILWSFVHGLSFLLADPTLAKWSGDADLEDILGDTADRVLAV